MSTAATVFRGRVGGGRRKKGGGRTPLMLVLVICPSTTHPLSKLHHGDLKVPGGKTKYSYQAPRINCRYRRRRPLRRKRPFVVQAQIRTLSPPLASAYSYLVGFSIARDPELSFVRPNFSLVVRKGATIFGRKKAFHERGALCACASNPRDA